MSPPPTCPRGSPYHLIKNMLTITNLTASVEGKIILKNFSLALPLGQVVALMGPNGSGKSTLANVLVGHPSYSVTGGTIFWDGMDILTMEPEERAQHGIFLAFQYPPSLPGVSVSQFLRLALNAQEKSRAEKITGIAPFIKQLRLAMKEMAIPLSFAERAVNDGFSGGEKKRLEMLQMLILKPRLIILDEIDSGLDIDAIKIVAAAASSMRSPERTIIAITHYQRLLNYLKPDAVHIIKEGSLSRSGGPELALTLESGGYANL